VAGVLLLSLAAERLAAQSIEVVPDTTRVTVGDPLTLRIVPHLPPGASLLTRTAGLTGDAPEGLRILEADSLAPGADGAVQGTLRVAFFRPGKQSVPPLALAYVTGPGAEPDTLRSAPVPIDVIPVLPPGEQTLRDIKDLAPLPHRSRLWLWLLLGAAALAATFFLVRRLRRKPARPVAVLEEPVAVPDHRSPYERAVERLAAIERARLPEQGDVAGHFELVTDTLRRYLEESRAAPALELTTSELALALPPMLAAGRLRESAVALLSEADLVKFARLRPSSEAAARLLRAARSLLEDWHAASISALAQSAAADAEAVPSGDGAGPGEASLGTKRAPELVESTPVPSSRPVAPADSRGSTLEERITRGERPEFAPPNARTPARERPAPTASDSAPRAAGPKEADSGRPRGKA
jgi:hypothetical protein